MPRISTKSNPTGLKDIDKSRIEIVIEELAGQKAFRLSKFDVTNLNLSRDLRLVCIARAGNVSARYELGTVGSWERSPQLLDLISGDALKFRILIHPSDDPKLVASAENLRPVGSTEQESLIEMVPIEGLGERVWELNITEAGAVLKFNPVVYPTAAAMVNDEAFAALVLPEIVRQIANLIARTPDRLDDEGDFLNAWGNWLDSEQIPRPEMEDDAQDDELAVDEWVDTVVERFCTRHKLATRLKLKLEGVRQ